MHNEEEDLQYPHFLICRLVHIVKRNCNLFGNCDFDVDVDVVVVTILAVLYLLLLLILFFVYLLMLLKWGLWHCCFIKSVAIAISAVADPFSCGWRSWCSSVAKVYVYWFMLLLQLLLLLLLRLQFFFVLLLLLLLLLVLLLLLLMLLRKMTFIPKIFWSTF